MSPAPSAVPSRRHCAALYSVLFVMGADMFGLPMLLPAIAGELETTVAHSSVLVVAFGATYATCSAPACSFLRGVNSRSVICIGVACAAAASLAAAVAPSFAWVVALRAVSGMAAAVANPAVWSALNAAALAHRRGRIMLTGTAVSAAGQMTGIPMGAGLGAAGMWRGELVIMAIAFLFSCIAVRALVAPAGESGEPWSRGRRHRELRRSLHPWQDRSFILAVTANIAAQTARLGSYSFVALLLVQRYQLEGIGLAGIGIATGAASFTGAAVAAVLISYWMRRGRTEMEFVSACTLVLLAGVVLFTAPMGALPAMAGLCLSFAAASVVFGTTQLHIASRFQGDRAALAWNSSGMYVGAALGTFLLGLVSVGPLFLGATVGFVLLSTVASSWAARASGDNPPR